MTKRQWRDLCVRAIEDAIIIFLGGVCIWTICWLVTGIFRALGVA